MSIYLPVNYTHIYPEFYKGVDEQGPYFNVEYLFDNWADSDNVMYSLLGKTTYIAGSVVKGGPHQHPLNPNLYCRAAEVVEGYGQPILNTNGLPNYTGGFKVRATYRMGTLDGQINPSDDPNNFNQIDPTTPLLWCTQEIDHETEVITVPNHSYKWSTGLIANIPIKVEIGLTIMKLTFHQLPYMPMGVARNLRGRINSKTFLGASKGTVRFRGATTIRDFSSDGTVVQKVAMTFVERDYDWNYYLRPDSFTWDTINDGAGNHPFMYADLTPLIKL